MFVGKVIGTVWSTVKWPQLQGVKLLLVRPYHLADLASLGSTPPAGPVGDPRTPSPGGGPDCEAVVCVDLLDAGVGDDVVVAFGHAARVAAQNQIGQAGQAGQSLQTQKLRGPPKGSAAGASPPVVPIDAAVVAIVDSIRVALPST